MLTVYCSATRALWLPVRYNKYSMRIEVDSVEAMDSLACQIASQLAGGDVIELVGDVGAGKTTFTKALALELGVLEAVQSPTFTISAVYALPNQQQLAHYDFYRLTEPGVMREELAEAVDDRQTITVLEWADVVADVLPADRLTIQFEYLPDESSRAVTLVPRGERAQQIIAGVQS